MALSLLGAPFSAFYDNNGAPLNGGLIYTYDAGTTTPKDTYTTSSGLVANSNPVVLDSGGRAAIWLNGNYKIVVKDSLGNTIMTTDNVTSATSTGNMNTGTYDPAAVNEQLVGLTASQTLSNKRLLLPTMSGVTNASNAAAGDVGEIQESTLAIGSATSLTTNVAKTITSISLTAGDWDVWGNIGFIAAATTVPNAFVGSINTVTNTHATPPNGGAYFTDVVTRGTASTNVFPIGRMRVSISSTTTYYLVGTASFTTSTLTAYGYIGARRIR